MSSVSEPLSAFETPAFETSSLEIASWESQRAPEPVGAYPHARRVGICCFCLGWGPGSAAAKPFRVLPSVQAAEILAYDISLQCHSVFANVRTVLQEAGARWEDLVDVTVYLTNMQADFQTFNSLWAEYFPDPATRPCRTTVEVGALPTPIAIELKCLAEFKSAQGASHAAHSD